MRLNGQGNSRAFNRRVWLDAMAAFFFLLGKSTIESAIEGLKVMAGNDLNVDDTIILDGRPARITRISLWKTTMFVYEVGCSEGKPYIKGGNKVSVQNTKLKAVSYTHLTLPTNREV